MPQNLAEMLVHLVSSSTVSSKSPQDVQSIVKTGESKAKKGPWETFELHDPPVSEDQPTVLVVSSNLDSPKVCPALRNLELHLIFFDAFMIAVRDQAHEVRRSRRFELRCKLASRQGRKSSPGIA